MPLQPELPAAISAGIGDGIVLALIAAGTALATGLGALPVIALGDRAARLERPLVGVAAVIMAVAAIAGLLLPAYRDGPAFGVTLAALGGGSALALSRRYLRSSTHVPHRLDGEAGARSVLVVGVLFAHSFPEGLAIGSAYAATDHALGAFVIAAIALQNVPEGTATAAALRPAGFGARAQFWTAVLTSAPQVPGALIAWLAVRQIDGLLPLSFALAGGAMLALVAIDMLPSALRGAPPERPLNPGLRHG